GAAARAALQLDLDLYRGIATAIEDFTAVDFDNGAHEGGLRSSHPSPYEWGRRDVSSCCALDLLAPGALQDLIGLPLLNGGDIVAGEGFAVLARRALDPCEDKALRAGLVALPGLEGHLRRGRRAGFGVTVIVDRRTNLPDRASGRLGLAIPFGEARE